MSNLPRTVQHFPKMKVRGKRNRRREFWDRRLRFISEATIRPVTWSGAAETFSRMLLIAGGPTDPETDFLKFFK